MKCHCEALRRVIEIYVSGYQADLSKYKRTKESRSNHHRFVPAWNSINIIDTLSYLRKLLIRRMPKESNMKSVKFIDCGCGIGNITILAYAAGFDVTGIEYNLATYKVAERLRQPGSKVIRGDITTYGNYADYDVIYFYVPMICSKKMKKFLNRAMNDMKVGAFIISYGAYYGDYIRKDKRFEHKKNKVGAMFEKVKEINNK